MDTPCKKCGNTLRRLILLAMMMDCGAYVSPSPLDCEHDFTPETKDAELTIRKEA